MACKPVIACSRHCETHRVEAIHVPGFALGVDCFGVPPRKDGERSASQRDNSAEQVTGGKSDTDSNHVG